VRKEEEQNETQAKTNGITRLNLIHTKKIHKNNHRRQRHCRRVGVPNTGNPKKKGKLSTPNWRKNRQNSNKPRKTNSTQIIMQWKKIQFSWFSQGFFASASLLSLSHHHSGGKRGKNEQPPTHTHIHIHKWLSIYVKA
jgi:hypothetical protein